MVRFCFVILHYMAETHTCECVQSIKQLYKDEYIHIIIVDNASSNGSGTRLEQLYQADDSITVLCQKENLGFARGNNIGYKFAKEYLNPEYVICVNNDIVFIQETFLKEIELLDNKYHFDVLGPDILDISQQKHQNPMRDKPLTVREISKIIRGKEIYLNAQKKGIIWKFIMLIYVLIHPQQKRGCNHENETLSCVLQGSCVIFSAQYMNMYDTAFHPATFLYFEEDILRFIIDRNHGIMLYSPRIKVVHKEDKSTDMIVSSKKEKNIFKAQHMIQSAKVLCDLVQKEDKNQPNL